MAHRDALREFQNRLALRLQEARSTGTAASWLAVEAGGGRFLLPLSHAGEIFSWVATQPVPYTQPWFLGVANLRGGLYGVVDLGSFVAGQAAPLRHEGVLAQCRLVALNTLLEVNCALLVDRLSGLRGVDSFTASASASEGAPAFFGHVYTDTQGERWQELNLQLLSQQTDFLTISA